MKNRGTLIPLLRLAGPLAAAYAGQQVMSVVDAAVVGRLGPDQMAGTSLGSALFAAALVLGMGLITGMDPLTSQAVGAQRLDDGRRAYGAALKVAIWLTLPLAVLVALGWGALALGPVDEGSVTQCGLYLVTRGPGMLPALLYIAGRGMVQALGHGRPVLVATLAANALNIPLSLVFAFGGEAGGFGLGWGVAGVGLASTIASGLQAWIMMRAAKAASAAPLPPTTADLKALVRVGWPISVQMGAEVGIFAGITLLMGGFGPVITSGHHVALMLASFTFTVCLGLAGATSTLVGQAVGEGQPDRARAAGRMGLLTGMGFMCCTGATFWLASEPLARIITDEAEVIAVAVPFLKIAGLFQISDGLQAVGAGAWRGLGRTRLPLVANLLGHWLVGFPLAMWLAYGTDEGPRGLWWGVTAGLTAVGLLLAVGFEIVARKPATPSTHSVV